MQRGDGEALGIARPCCTPAAKPNADPGLAQVPVTQSTASRRTRGMDGEGSPARGLPGAPGKGHSCTRRVNQVFVTRCCTTPEKENEAAMIK